MSFLANVGGPPKERIPQWSQDAENIFCDDKLKWVERSALSSVSCLLSPVFCYNFPEMPEVKCPHCGRYTEYTGNISRPFCSERCKLLDFGAWADGEYALPAETSSLTEEDIDDLEKAAGRDLEN